MKERDRILQATVMLCASLWLCGCGNTAETGAVTEIEAEESTAEKVRDLGSEEPDAKLEEGYYFTANGIKIQTDMDMDELAPQLGEYKSVFEAPSCAGEGVSYLYNFISYEIETYPAGDEKNRIAYIVLKDDTVTTPEGVDLSMTKEDVTRIYGEDYEVNGDKITYSTEDTKFNFIFDNP